MKQYTVKHGDGETVVNYDGGEMPESEARAYVERAKERFGSYPNAIDAQIDGEEVELTYGYGNLPFQRIRRITGYLVGDLSRFNNAKRAEEHDRVKHGVDTKGGDR